MYDYYCSLCWLTYSMEYSVIRTKQGRWHCGFCVDERYKKAEEISEEEKEKIRNEYEEEEFGNKLFLHRLCY